MNLKIYQRFYIQSLFIDNKVQNYVEAKNNFTNKFNNINFLLNEDNIRKIKNSILGGVNNYRIEDLCKLIGEKNRIKVSIYPISSEYYNKTNKQTEIREQNIIILGESNMLKYLNSDIGKFYGIDCTYKIIPRSYKPYKLITIYVFDTKNNKSLIAAFICIKYTDFNSLIKIFSLLSALYNFSPVAINTDFNMGQIKAIKNCTTFKQKPYVICCLFHFSQSILRELKEFNLIKKKLTNRAFEILYNLEILCFIEIRMIKEQFKILKDNISMNLGEKN